jgi:F420-dependent oxidoreductase-like protein
MRDDPDAFAAQAARLEDIGVAYLWAGEAYSADAVSTMGFLAAVTKRAQIGSSILPLYSRTPTLLAMTAVGIDKLSRGRCVLGLGASGPQVIEGFHGVVYDAPLARTREIIEICRSVWRRERLVHEGANYQVPLGEGEGTGLGKALKIMEHPVRERIPIFVASLGGGVASAALLARTRPRAVARPARLRHDEASCGHAPAADRGRWLPCDRE